MTGKMGDEDLQKLYRYFEENTELYIDRLSDAVAIPSVSGLPERRDDCVRIMKWMKQRLDSINCDCRMHDLGNQTFYNGTVKPYPPVLLAQYGSDPTKKTLLIYCHLDVQPAEFEDGWNTDPFKLTRVGDVLYGRGSSDDKGPAIGWYNCLEAMQTLGIPVPLNIKFIFEGMEESASLGMNQCIAAIKDSFLAGIDFICVADTRWIGKRTPCIAYGNRGLLYMAVEIEGANKDLHSGVYGGAVYEPMTDLIHLLHSLVDTKGKVLVEGFYDDVAPLADEELDLYSKVDFDEKEYASDAGISELLHDNKMDVLLHTWRYPTLSLHGISGADSTASLKTAIPCKVFGKFSMRIVPNMTEGIGDLIKKHLLRVHAHSGSPNICRVHVVSMAFPLYTAYNSPHCQAACRASQRVYGMEPDLVRQGGCVPICNMLYREVCENMVLLPVGRGDDNAHAQNEKIDVRNYIDGMKLMATYLSEISGI